jgi:hypothetical protein
MTNARFIICHMQLIAFWAKRFDPAQKKLTGNRLGELILFA